MGHIGQILFSRTAMCPLMSEQKYLILLSFINPPNVLPSYPWQFVLLFCKKTILFFTAFYSVSFCLSTSLANNAARFVCTALTVTEHRCLFYFGQRGSLSPSTELIALSSDSHPVRPIVFVEYALNVSAICSADCQALCHLLIFWVFFMLKLLDFFLPPTHCQTAAKGSDWQMFSIWIPGYALLKRGCCTLTFSLHCWSDPTNVFIYPFIYECQSSCLVLMLT